MDTGNIGKRDGLEELLSTPPDRDEKPPQIWLVAPETVAAGTSTLEAQCDEKASLSDSDEVQLHELMSAWSRASEEVQQRFLTRIAASLTLRAEEGPGLGEIESSQEAESSQEPDQSQEATASHEAEASSEPAESSETMPQQNALFEMWKDYKSNTQVTGRQWVVDGCPSEYRDSHFIITERLEPFRAGAVAATPEQRQQFLELSGAFTA